jgi:hypothetical protein
VAKIRTAGHLQSALEAGLGWRVVELGALRAAISVAVEPRRSALIRAAIPIIYAHWEGYVKRAASDYGLYLNSRGLTYRDLKPCFIGIAALGTVNQLHRIERRISSASTLAGALLRIEDTAVSIELWPRLNEVGNLNFDMLMEIVEFLNLTPSLYSTKKAFIDETLVASRNRIAHGERLLVDREAIENTMKDALDLINVFKEDIEEAASSGTFRR